ncbi:MFS transporter [Actinomadura algeriensis]|uniref:EmrB/QacA subfamily drug resistance transporter n=1 Tax=Actinomadura algeriensis TaxID=1679523 RepID=A0ABR9JUP6_9ACTN|nr:MFS transporter [Actinomadura algeriensis]MBE1534291.1 EmrB/QacA subfamily drug resistance transporter [Actinomadura algeriensis]
MSPSDAQTAKSVAPGEPGGGPGGAGGGPGRAAPFGAVFAIVAAGVAMSNLDLFIVNVALPQVGDHFAGASLASLSWILNAYAVVFAALLVPAGGLADRAGARRAYLLGIAVFTVASVACAVAPGVWWLVAARVLQAAGAAALIPSSLGLLLAAAPPERRMAAVRGWTAISGLAAALGPVLGGLLTELDWRWVFLVNVPIGVVAILAGVRMLPGAPARPDARRPDLLGAALLTAGIAALAFGVVRSESWGWASPQVLGALAGAAALLALFVLRSARHPAPVLPLGVLRAPAFSPASLANVLFAVAFAAMLLSCVLWCQDVWEWSALRTGLAITPGPLMVPALAIGGAPLARKIGAGPLALVGCAVFAAGIAWWMWRMTDGYALGMLPGMLLTGVGVGLTLPTLIGAAVAALPPTSFSTGSAVVTMARQVGTVVGVAALIAVLGGGESARTAADFDAGWLLTIAATLAAAAVCLFIPRARKA